MILLQNIKTIIPLYYSYADIRLLRGPEATLILDCQDNGPNCAKQSTPSSAARSKSNWSWLAQSWR